MQPRGFPRVLRTLAIGGEPRADEAAAGHGREIVYLRKQPVLLQRLENAQGKGGAAYSASGDRQAGKIRRVFGPGAAPKIDLPQLVLENPGPLQRVRPFLGSNIPFPLTALRGHDEQQAGRADKTDDEGNDNAEGDGGGGGRRHVAGDARGHRQQEHLCDQAHQGEVLVLREIGGGRGAKTADTVEEQEPGVGLERRQKGQQPDQHEHRAHPHDALVAHRQAVAEARREELGELPAYGDAGDPGTRLDLGSLAQLGPCEQRALTVGGERGPAPGPAFERAHGGGLRPDAGHEIVLHAVHRFLPQQASGDQLDQRVLRHAPAGRGLRLPSALVSESRNLRKSASLTPVRGTDGLDSLGVAGLEGPAGGSPPEIGALDRAYEAIVAQLVPMGAGADLGADDVALLQHADYTIGDVTSALVVPEDQAAGAGGRDELALEPLAQLSFVDPGLCDGGVERLLVEPLERVVGITVPAVGIEGDRG